MAIIRFLVFIALLWALPAHADVTIVNFDNMGDGDEVTKYDTAGNIMDAHAGRVVQVGTTFYLYGESYSCGFRVFFASAWCGFKVYSSPDLIVWTYVGYLFDATTQYWQDRCAGTSGAGGCYNLQPIYNPNNNTFVFWFNQDGPANAYAPDYLFVFVCSTPTSGCVQQTDPTGLATGYNDDVAIAVDASGNGYVTCNCGRTSGNPLIVYALNSSFTDAVGSPTSTGITGAEAYSFFERSGTWYIVYTTPQCGFCVGGVNTTYISASSALGTYSAPTTLNVGSCNGQNRSVDTIVAGGITTYLHSTDQWSGHANEGNANSYIHPLSFTGSAIDPYTCQAHITIPGITPTTPVWPGPTPDQTSVPNGDNNFFYSYQTSTSDIRMQTFVPTTSTLSYIKMSLGQACSNYGGSGTIPCSPPLDAPVNIKLTTLDGSNNPVTTLATATIQPSQLSWAVQWMTVPFNVTGLTPGTHYGLVVQTTSSNGAAGISITNSTPSPYAAGVERYSTDGGATWTTEATRALMFSTFSNPLPQDGGGRRL